jgi:septal ring factor EnvC (AmiA/AmiB activator)
VIKQSDTSRRAVTETDLQLVDRAIADHETFQRDLYVLRRVLSEVGDLDQQYRGGKQAIEAVQAEGANVSRQLEYAKEQLAKVQQELIERRQELAELTAEVQEKQRTLEAYSAQIDKIMGKAA